MSLLTRHHATRGTQQRYKAMLLAVFLGGVSAKAVANGFAFFRYDDDFTYLADPTQRVSWYDDAKYIPVSGVPNGYLSLGADLRERVESYDYGYFGLTQAPHTTYDLSRALVDADLHLDQVRFFLQLENVVETGRRPAAIPTDEDRGDVQQVFVDYAPSLGGGKLTLRAGRFEMKFGEGLLISPRDGPNIRQAWDGGWAFFERPALRIDMFAVRPVTDKPGYFDDAGNPRQSLWGAYTTWMSPVPGYAGDVYYVGNVNHAVALYAGTRLPGDEHTSTVGGRWYGHSGQFDSTQEVSLQTGHFNTRSVLAYAVHNEAGWTFTELPWKPRLGLKADVLSGSRNPATGAVGTFNALYPNISYGSDAVLEAPANLVAAGFDGRLSFTSAFDADYTGAGLWRYSTRDAFYASPLFPLIPGNAGRQRYSGIEQQLAGNWRLNPYLTLRASVVHFSVGGFVAAAHGRDTNFALLYLAARL